jgi:hypothetical protein
VTIHRDNQIILFKVFPSAAFATPQPRVNLLSAGTDTVMALVIPGMTISLIIVRHDTGFEDTTEDASEL